MGGGSPEHAPPIARPPTAHAAPTPPFPPPSRHTRAPLRHSCAGRNPRPSRHTRAPPSFLRRQEPLTPTPTLFPNSSLPPSRGEVRWGVGVPSVRHRSRAPRSPTPLPLHHPHAPPPVAPCAPHPSFLHPLRHSCAGRNLTRWAPPALAPSLLRRRSGAGSPSEYRGAPQTLEIAWLPAYAGMTERRAARSWRPIPHPTSSSEEASEYALACLRHRHAARGARPGPCSEYSGAVNVPCL